MNLAKRSHAGHSAARTLTWLVGGLSLLALANHTLARRAERKHPPRGTFIEVDGVRLHYSSRGTGDPVVLIHGNMVTGDDFNTSGVASLLLKAHRVIIFDRPGFGYSERPRGRSWTVTQQADLLHKALHQLGIERPVIVGHSWGAMVALALAQRYPDDVAGLVVLSGYYFPTLRPDVLLAGITALPIIGDILRYTVSPLFGWLTMPLLKRGLFAPARVPQHFHDEYSAAMSLRPSQLRASALDGALMISGAFGLRSGYKDLSMPVVIMAGDGDRVVFKRSAERLQACIHGSDLQIVEGAGHMVHHLAARQVLAAVETVSLTSGKRSAAKPPSAPAA